MGQLLVAQPRLTLDYPAMAKRLVAQLALKPGEKVLSLAQAGIMADLLPHLRYEVMRAGGIDLGVDRNPARTGAGGVRRRRHRQRRARVAGALQGDVPRCRRRHHDAGRHAGASGLRGDAGLAERRSHASIAAGAPFIFTGWRTAAPIRSPASRCPSAPRSTRFTSARCCRPTIARWRSRAAVRGGAQRPARCASPRRPEPICASAPAIGR